MKELNHLGKQYQKELIYIHAQAKERAEKLAKVEKFHVSSVGGQLTKGYEKIRIASENADESLLLQRAIMRFYKRLILTPNLVNKSGQELITELTLAGYLENDTVATSTIREINQIIDDYMGAREVIKKEGPKDKLNAWTIEPMSAHIGSLLRDDGPMFALGNLAYNFFLETIPVEDVFNSKPAGYEALSLVAVWQALLKIDAPIIRYQLAKRYQVSPKDADNYIKFNQQIDAILKSSDDEKLARIISRYSARFRVMLKIADNGAIPKALDKQDVFLSHYQSATQSVYKSLLESTNTGILRSTILIIVVKFIIGLFTELPYDMITNGSLQITPLTINFFFPPLYMVLLRFTMKMPGKANTVALEDDIKKVLYAEVVEPLPLKRNIASEDYGLGYKIFYIITFLALSLGVGWLLYVIGFEWLRLTVFFISICTASFLGFRLSRKVREIEVVETQQAFSSTLRDFLYMPFVIIGRWLNERFAQLAIVTRTLDNLIELPMKSVLRIVRRWSAFLNAKKDEL